MLFAVVALLFQTNVAAQNVDRASHIRNDFKFTLLSLGSGSTRITYERAFSRLNSAEATVGIIGLGWDWMNKSNPQGLLLKFAFKWRLLPHKNDSNWLAGFYVKPEFVWTQFRHKWQDQDRWSEQPECPDETRQMALLAECGYQLLAGWFVFDIYAGLGPSWGTGNWFNYYHSFMLFPADGRLAFTSGFRIGVAF